MRPGELALIAKSFAVALDSGKSPEKPPLATTPGSFPEKKHVWVLKHKQRTQTCYVTWAGAST